VREEFKKWTKTLHPELQETVEGSEIFFMTFRGGATSRQPEIDALNDKVSTYRNLAECWQARFNTQSDEKLKLTEENAALKAENELNLAANRGLGRLVDELQAENEQLLKDAERYRWLADQDLDDRIFIVCGTNGTWGECGHSGFGGLKDLIDEIIDEAMKEAD